MKAGVHVSENYVTTINPKSSTDAMILLNIKKSVKATNAELPKNTNKRFRVTLRGRHPFFRQTNYATGNLVSYDYSGNIVKGLKNAKEIDVYVYQVWR